jgi:hypothetical protein
VFEANKLSVKRIVFDKSEWDVTILGLGTNKHAKKWPLRPKSQEARGHLDLMD